MKRKTVMKKKPQRVVSGQKALRTAARDCLVAFLAGESLDINRANIAIAALHAPERKGE